MGSVRDDPDVSELVGSGAQLGDALEAEALQQALDQSLQATEPADVLEYTSDEIECTDEEGDSTTDLYLTIDPKDLDRTGRELSDAEQAAKLAQKHRTEGPQAVLSAGVAECTAGQQSGNNDGNVADTAARILQLLRENGSILCSRLPHVFQERFGTSLDYKANGFKKLQLFLESIEGVSVKGTNGYATTTLTELRTAETPSDPVLSRQASGTISTQTSDGAAAVSILRSLAATFRSRAWPGSKAELKNAIKAAQQQNPSSDGIEHGALVNLWKSSSCLTGKGTKKHKYVWNHMAVERALAAAPAAPMQSQASASSLASVPPGVQYIDTVEQLEAAVMAIADYVSVNEVRQVEPEIETAVDPSLTESQRVIAIGTKSGAEGLSLVQLATFETVYLFDCITLTAETVALKLAALCCDPRVTKFAFDIHQAAYVFGDNIEFHGTFDIQLAIELLTSDPRHSLYECIAQLKPEQQQQTQTHQLQRIGAADPSCDARPLPALTKERAANEMRDLLSVWPRVLEAVESDLSDVQHASDLRAGVGASSDTGSRQIVFDAANCYAIVSPELLQATRPNDAHIPERLLVSNDTDVLLDLLPTDIGNELRHTDEESEDLTLLLSDIVLDKGRPACAWIDGERMTLGADGRVIGMDDIDAVLDSLGGFGSDNRAGLEQQLHRISGMRNRNGDVIGLTMRVGRHVSGNADMISDLLFGDDRSILFLGEPGSGKTTIVREATRLLSMESNVCVVDTSNEIAGDGDVPHPCIGLARRMMVPSLDEQAAVMVECVQNHTPETMVIDEIGRSAEVEAARTCKQRGVRMIASAHGDLRKLVKNKQLRNLVGGVESVTLGDAAAKAEATKGGFSSLQKIKPQRSGPATFDIIVELRRGEQHEWRIIMDAGKAVDCILEGRTFPAQRRTRDAHSGTVELTLESI
eukprot:COSAG02_NODE_1059_length_14871_cov_5.877208_4_plen_926_part_00